MMKPETIIHFRIDRLGPAVSFKNSKKIIRIKGRPGLTTKASLKLWMNKAILMLRLQVNRKDLPGRLTQKREASREKDAMKRLASERAQAVSVRTTVGYSSLNAPDIDGAQSTILDCLRDAGAIPDDSPRYVKATAISWQPCEVGQEYTQISITLD